MKLFAGTFFFKNTLTNKLPELDIDILKISKKGIFVMGGLEEGQSVRDIQVLLGTHLGEVEYQDISTEDDKDQIEILLEEFDNGVFESVSFEGPEISFDVVLERFSESDEVLCVREAEASHKFGNKVIRVDFLY